MKAKKNHVIDLELGDIRRNTEIDGIEVSSSTSSTSSLNTETLSGDDEGGAGKDSNVLGKISEKDEHSSQNGVK